MYVHIITAHYEEVTNACKLGKR